MQLVMDNKVLRLIRYNFNLNDPIQKALLQSALFIQNQAKLNAPVGSPPDDKHPGTLRRSITTDVTKITKGIVIVGSPVIYSLIRNYVNFKNPQTLNYLIPKARDMQKERILDIFMKAFKNFVG